METVGPGETAGRLEHIDRVDQFRPIAGDIDQPLAFTVKNRFGKIDLQVISSRGEAHHRGFEMGTRGGG